MGIFYQKKHFTPGKKSGKTTLPPDREGTCTSLIGWSWFSHGNHVFWKMAPRLTMVNHGTFGHGHHGWPWSTMVHSTMLWPCFWKMVPRLTMVNHDTFDHGQQWYFWPCFWKMAPWLTMVNHGKVWPWLTMVNVVPTTVLWPCFWLWADHGHWPWSKAWPLTVVPFFKSAVNHGLTMVKTHVWTMVDHGWTMFFFFA